MNKAALVRAGIQGLYADERKDKTTIREQVETAVMIEGEEKTATTTVQRQKVQERSTAPCWQSTP